MCQASLWGGGGGRGKVGSGSVTCLLCANYSFIATWYAKNASSRAFITLTRACVLAFTLASIVCTQSCSYKLSHPHATQSNRSLKPGPLQCLFHFHFVLLHLITLLHLHLVIQLPLLVLVEFHPQLDLNNLIALIVCLSYWLTRMRQINYKPHLASKTPHFWKILEQMAHQLYGITLWW